MNGSAPLSYCWHGRPEFANLVDHSHALSLLCCRPHHHLYPPFHFCSNASPDNKEGPVVDAGWGSLTHVIDSVFSDNVGTALQNRGTMMVISSRFLNNVATPFFDFSDNIEQGAGVGGAIMNSPDATMVMNDCCLVGNSAETDGPAIWSAGNVAEVGGSCASSNVVTGSTSGGSRNCNGVFDQESSTCQPFIACGDGVCTVAKSTMRTR